MNEIIAKKLIVLHKNGHKDEYTHVTKIETTHKKLFIEGETDDSFKMRHNVMDINKIDDLHIMIVEFYIPKI